MASKTMVAARMSECETNQSKRGGQTDENGGLMTIQASITLYSMHSVLLLIWINGSNVDEYSACNNILMVTRETCIAL